MVLYRIVAVKMMDLQNLLLFTLVFRDYSRPVDPRYDQVVVRKGRVWFKITAETRITEQISFYPVTAPVSEISALFSQSRLIFSKKPGIAHIKHKPYKQ